MKTKHYLQYVKTLLLALVTFSGFAQTDSSGSVSYLVAVGDSIQLSDPTASAAKKTWISSDNTIAKVRDDGMVFGESAGNVTIAIMVSDSSIVMKWPVAVYSSGVIIPDSVGDTVKTPIIEPPIIVNKNYYMLQIGQEINVLNDSTTLIPSAKWHIGDTTIVVIDNLGNATGLSVGETTALLITANNDTLKHLTIYVYNNSTTDSGIVVTPIIQNYYKLAINEKMQLSDTLVGTWTSSDSSIVTVANGIVVGLQQGNAVVTVVTANNITINWTIFVYNIYNYTDSTVSSQPSYVSIYASVGETGNIFNYIGATDGSIEWVGNGAILGNANGTFHALAPGIAKGYVVTANASTTPQYFEITVAQNNTISKDSLYSIIASPTITAENLPYQNYSSIVKIDDYNLRIVFDKEITSVDSLLQYLSLQIIDSTNLKSGSTLTITSVAIDPSNKNALLVTTKEIIPNIASVSVTYNNVLLYSDKANAYATLQYAKSEVFVEAVKSDKIVVWPVVATNNVTVTANMIKTITIYDILGKKIETISVNGSQIIIDVSSFEVGKYFVLINLEHGKTTTKTFIKD